MKSAAPEPRRARGSSLPHRLYRPTSLPPTFLRAPALRAALSHFLSVLAVFAISPALDRHQTLPLALTTLLLSSVPILLIARPALRPLPAPSFLAAARTALLLLAIRTVGSTRVLIASGAVAPLADLAPRLFRAAPRHPGARRRALRAALTTFLAAYLIAYDSTGGRAPSEHAERVRRQVMRTRAGIAVGSGLHLFADRYRAKRAPPRDRFVLPRATGRAGPQIGDGPVPLVEEEDDDASAVGERVDSGGGGGGSKVGVSDGGVVDGAAPDAADAPAQALLTREVNGSVEKRGRARLVALEVAAGATAGAKLKTLQGGEKLPANTRRHLLAIVRQGGAFLSDGKSGFSDGGGGGGGGGDGRSSNAVEVQAGGAVELNSTAAVTDVSLAEGFAGVTMAVASFSCAAWEVDAIAAVASDIGTTSVANALSSVGGAVVLLPFVIFTSSIWPGSEGGFLADIFDQADWNTLAFAFLFFVCPQLLLGEGKGNVSGGRPFSAQSSRRESKDGSSRTTGGLSGTDPVLGVNVQSRHALAQYLVVMFSIFTARFCLHIAGGVEIIPYSFSLWLATIAFFSLLYVNHKAPSDMPRNLARQGLTSGGNGPLLSIGRSSRGPLSAIPRVQRKIGAAFTRVGSFVAQSRSHKASWQVFNFLVMQSGMVVVETSYAFVTDSVGLVSISADNLFCCLALAAGLFAIRITASHNKPSAKFSFGLARLESLCGFVNGILLLVVAVLLMLEAINRVVDPKLIDSNHIFAVCLVGIVGNGLGLVFFPPESRRENHNVQSIYLHIWANTLAYAGVSMSAVVLELNPALRVSELVVAFFVAAVVVLSSVPLLLRSSRLLLNQPAAERMADIEQTRAALSALSGVVDIPEFRVWNLTPTSMVLILHIVLTRDTSVDEQDVFQKARSLCFQLGAPITQTTIQITRVGDALLKRRQSLGSFDVECSPAERL